MSLWIRIRAAAIAEELYAAAQAAARKGDWPDGERLRELLQPIKARHSEGLSAAQLGKLAGAFPRLWLAYLERKQGGGVVPDAPAASVARAHRHARKARGGQ